MEVVVTTGAVSRAKLQSNHHQQQTSTKYFYRPDALPVAQLTVSKHWRENITSNGLDYPKLTCGLPTLSLTINSSWLPWGRFAIPLISPLMPVSLVTEELDVLSHSCCQHKPLYSFIVWVDWVGVIVWCCCLAVDVGKQTATMKRWTWKNIGNGCCSMLRPPDTEPWVDNLSCCW